MAAEFTVELRDVVKRFITPEGHELAAVDHVTMQIKNGEFFSMLGSSGCGKTTSLRMIAGFEWPTEGEVYIEGKPMGHTPPFQRKVNTVFQSYALFQHMTVFQNIAFGLEMEGADKSEIEKRVKRALEMVQLTGMERRKPKQLSGGQQQRVAIARSLVNDPYFILADEPTGNLDTKTTGEILLIFEELSNQGKTIILVTHEDEVAKLTKRIIRLRDGWIQSDELNKGRVLLQDRLAVK
jgi:spermidine/putrescine transport system ATP-binding protein